MYIYLITNNMKRYHFENCKKYKWVTLNNK